MHLLDILDFKLENSLQGNVPGSARQFTKSSIMRLVNVFNKPIPIKLKVNEELYTMMHKPVFEKIKKDSTMHSILKYIMNTLGYQGYYSIDFVSYLLALKVLVGATHNALDSGLIISKAKNYKKENEKNIELEQADKIIQKYIKDKNDYINIFLIELIPMDTASLLVKNADFLSTIKNDALLQLYLTPNLIYLQFINSLLLESYQTLIRVSFYTDAITYLFLFMRYQAITNYIQKYKSIKYPRQAFDNKALIKDFIEPYAQKQLNQLENFIATVKKRS